MGAVDNIDLTTRKQQTAVVTATGSLRVPHGERNFVLDFGLLSKFETSFAMDPENVALVMFAISDLLRFFKASLGRVHLSYILVPVHACSLGCFLANCMHGRREKLLRILNKTLALKLLIQGGKKQTLPHVLAAP